jgi:hypothetical protein
VKPETQINIGRKTAIVLLFLLLATPPLFICQKINVEEEQVSLKQALIFSTFMYILLLPLVSILGGFAWALRRNKQKVAIVLFVIYVIWGVLSAIVSGIGLLLVEFVTVLLLLQGVLGIRKSQVSQTAYNDE